MNMIFEIIRSKTKQEWLDWATAQWNIVHNFLSADGLRAAAVGLGAGIIVVLFFKIIVTLIVIAAGVSAVVYQMAPEHRI